MRSSKLRERRKGLFDHATYNLFYRWHVRYFRSFVFQYLRVLLSSTMHKSRIVYNIFCQWGRLGYIKAAKNGGAVADLVIYLDDIPTSGDRPLHLVVGCVGVLPRDYVPMPIFLLQVCPVSIVPVMICVSHDVINYALPRSGYFHQVKTEPLPRRC